MLFLQCVADFLSILYSAPIATSRFYSTLRKGRKEREREGIQEIDKNKKEKQSYGVKNNQNTTLY